MRSKKEIMGQLEQERDDAVEAHIQAEVDYQTILGEIYALAIAGKPYRIAAELERFTKDSEDDFPVLNQLIVHYRQLASHSEL